MDEKIINPRYVVYAIGIDSHVIPNNGTDATFRPKFTSFWRNSYWPYSASLKMEQGIFCIRLQFKRTAIKINLLVGYVPIEYVFIENL